MIRFDNVSVRFPWPDGRTRSALNEISLTIDDGEFVAMLGLNGSGKTTLARLCNGLVLPTTGIVSIDGLQISATHQAHLPEIRRRVGMVFQNPENQIVSTTVEREIAFGLENLGIDPEEMACRVDKALRNFNLLQYRQHPPHRLSAGEKQRLALAAVLAMEPRHLILDEPTSLLDFAHQRGLMRIIQELHEHQNQPPFTILHITQYPPEALFANRLIILHQGKIFADGSPVDIFLQEERLREIGLNPPVEFSAYLRLAKRNFPVTSIKEILLKPIL